MRGCGRRGRERKVKKWGGGGGGGGGGRDTFRGMV